MPRTLIFRYSRKNRKEKNEKRNEIQNQISHSFFWPLYIWQKKRVLAHNKIFTDEIIAIKKGKQRERVNKTRKKEEKNTSWSWLY